MNWEEQKTSTIWLSILATVLLLLFSFSFWFYREVFNKSNFQKNISAALQTEHSKQALASIIIDQAFQDRPVVRNFLSEQAEPALSGMLGAPRVQTVFNKFISQVYESLFSTRPRPIVINISNIKTFVERLIVLIDQVSDREIPEVSIPDNIVLVRAGVIPSIARQATAILTIGPIALVISLGLFIWLFFRSARKSPYFIVVGLCLFLGPLITNLFIYWYQAILLGRFGNPDARVIAEEIVHQFSNSFLNQNTSILVTGLLMLAGGYIYQRFFQRPNNPAGKTAPTPVPHKSSQKGRKNV